MKIYFPLVLALLFFNLAKSQNTVGLLQYTSQVDEGYTLFTPEKSNQVFLIDNCGNSVHEWTFNSNPKLTCYLLDNGNILRTGSTGIEIRDWDNNLLWQYNLLTDSGLRQHHDIEPLPNGNFLCLVRDNITEAEQISMGKNPVFVNGDLKSEKIIEFQPIGNNDINIVWEWRFVDHLIQDFDHTLSNFGNVATHPELVDFNYNETNMDHTNWLHANSIDYHSGLDQILFSSRTLGEIYIIDHSTTTLEAASHSGGNHNKGGDFLWRWGNPAVYRQGTAGTQKLFTQHDAKWISEGYVNANKISVFNNDADGTDTYSSIHIISPVLDINENYELENNAFLPLDFYWSWDGEIINETLYQFKKGGVQALENGNLLICETSKGRLTEVTPNGDIAWIYRNPVGTTIHNQFDTDTQIFGSNSLFRGEKYPKDFPAFTGRDLEPLGPIENINTLTENCDVSLSRNTSANFYEPLIITNPVQNSNIVFHVKLNKSDLDIYNPSGQIVLHKKEFMGKKLAVPHLKSGLYFIRVKNSRGIQIQKILIP